MYGPQIFGHTLYDKQLGVWISNYLVECTHKVNSDVILCSGCLDLRMISGLRASRLRPAPRHYRCPFEAAGYKMLKYWHDPLEKVVHPLVPPWKWDPSYATARLLHRRNGTVISRIRDLSSDKEVPQAGRASESNHRLLGHCTLEAIRGGDMVVIIALVIWRIGVERDDMWKEEPSYWHSVVFWDGIFRKNW